MAGSQLVLHNRDDANQEIKDITRNIGLQSIVYNETASTGLAVKNANTIVALLDEMTVLLAKLSLEVDSYTQVANKLYYLIQNAYYTTPTRIQRLQELQQGAMRFIKD